MRQFRQLPSITLLAALGMSSFAQGVCDDDNVRERLCDPDQKSVYSRFEINLQRVWLMMAVFDLDEKRVPVAVVDIGFLDNGETRDPEHECFVNYVPSKFADDVDCDADVYGEYDGVLLATGNDAYKTHGTNMMNIVGATLNDGGAAGVAGQVAVPSLYRLDDVQSYLFELPATIVTAVDNGAAVINISGGFPCVIQLNTPPNSQTPNVCTNEGRWSFCNAPGMIAAFPGLSSLLCLGTELEGDLVSNIAIAAQYAADAGVPIVGSAGNISTEWLTDTVDLTGIVNWTVANSDAALWSIIPATVGPVTAAGAADTGRPYPNQDFHGLRVNTWAPFKDTSPAAAFVSALYAIAQAANPELSPQNEDLGSSELKELPVTLRTMLMDTAYTNDELAARCASDEPECLTDPTGLRRNLVHPYRFVRTAATGALPDFEGLGYSDSFDSFRSDREHQNDGLPSEATADDDWRDDVTLSVAPGASDEKPGTIFYVPGTTEMVDRDWYLIHFDGTSGARVDHHLELRYLDGYGELSLASPHDFLSLRETRVDGAEVIKVYDTVLFNQGARFPVEVHGATAPDDNLYKLGVVRGLNRRPNPDRFDRAGGNNNPDHPDNNDSADAATALALTPVLSPVGDSTRRWTIGVGELTTHSIDDRDYFRIELPSPPADGLVYQQRVVLTPDHPMIRVHVSVDGGPFQVLDAGGRPLHDDQNAVFFTEPRHPGLNLAYGLTGRVVYEPMEYEFLPVKAFADLEFAIERLQRHVGDVLPAPMGCLSCMTMKASGTIQVARDRHPVGALEGLPRDARSLNYLVVDKAQRVSIELTTTGRDNSRFGLYDVRGQLIATSDRERRLTADLRPGLYLAVVSRAGSGERELRYTLRRERPR